MMRGSSLKVLIPAAFLAAVVVLMVAQAAIFLADMRGSLLNQSQATLQMQAQNGASRLERWLKESERGLVAVAADAQTQEVTRQIASLLQGVEGGALEYLQRNYVTPNALSSSSRADFTPHTQPGAEPDTYARLHDRIHNAMRALLTETGAQDIALIDQTGRVIYSAYKLGDLGHLLTNGAFAETGLGRAFHAVQQAPPLQTVTIDFAPYAAGGQGPSGFMATAVTTATSDRLGVLALRFDEAHIANLLQNEAPISTAEGHELSFLPAYNAQPALSGGVENTDFLSATASTALPTLNWTVEASLPKAMALLPLKSATSHIIWSILIAGGVALCMGLLMGRWLAQPLATLTEATKGLLNREHTSIQHLNRKDEIGDLARDLNRLREDQIKAEAARREMLFKGKAFNTTSTAMMIVDAEGTLLYINEAALNLFRSNLSDFRGAFANFDPDNLIGTNISVFHRNHARNMSLLQNSGQRQTESDVTVGSQVFALGINPVEAEDGSHAGYVAVWENVREKRRHSAILGAVDHAQVVLEAGLDGRIINLNENGTAYYGYSAQEIIGKPMGILFKGGDEAARQVLERVLTLGSFTEEHHRITRTGEDRFVLCNLNAVHDRHGKVQRIVAICSDRTQEVIVRKQAAAIEQARAKDQAHVVDALRNALGALATGDLSVRIEQSFPAEYEELRENCNRASESLAQTLSEVSEVAAAILTGAEDIASAAGDLSRRTESQAATLEETAAALDTLTSNVRSTTEGTLRADGKVTSAHAEAKSNGSVVRSAIEAMTAIETSSQKISQIIGVIDDIAFQTNLLALNAGVEAARAGDAGRGFAVVAAEVRALAQRSSDAAKEIKTLIATSAAQVGAGAELVGQSGEAVTAIVSDIAEISKIVQAIAHAAQDQANGLGEINTGVAVLDKVTQQNAVMVEQSTAASSLLKTEADRLTDLLAGFNLIKNNSNAKQAGTFYAA